MSFLPIRKRLLNVLELLLLIAAVIAALWVILGCTLSLSYHSHKHYAGDAETTDVQSEAERAANVESNLED